MAATIQFHNTLHWLYTGKCTGIVFLEAKLIQNLTSMKEDILYDTYLYIEKIYNVLECNPCLEIVETYSVRPWAIRLLRKYWYQLNMVAWDV